MPSSTTGDGSRLRGDRDPRDDDEVEPTAEETEAEDESEACEGRGDVTMDCLDMATEMEPDSLDRLVDGDAKDDGSIDCSFALSAKPLRVGRRGTLRVLRRRRPERAEDDWRSVGNTCDCE